MAGATNRAMKAAGIPRATQNVIRVNSGGAHTLKSAIAVAAAHGAPVPDKVHAHIAARDAKAGAKTAKSAAAAENAAKRAEARAVYERGNASSGEKLAAMRSNLRQLVSEKRQADRDVTRARDLARAAAEKTLGAPKKGPKARENRLNHARALEAAENASPDVKRAAAAAVQARTALQSALQSRDATATARKAQRGAEAGGQQDLFSGAPAPRGPSPFERRMALRDARAAMVGNISRGMLADRKAGAPLVAAAKAASAAKYAAATAKERAESDAAWNAYKAGEAAKAATAERRTAMAKRLAPTLGGAARGMLAARRQQANATAAAASAIERSRTAATAAAVDRAAGASRVGKYKIEKNVTVNVTHRDDKGGEVRVPVKAIAKAGDMAVVKEKYGYGITHLPSGYKMTGMLPKNVAIQAVQGMASGRGAKALTSSLASQVKGGQPMTAKDARTMRATQRYVQVMNKRGAAVELQSARDAHARAVQGGNPTVVKAATTRLSDAEKNHKSAIKHAQAMRRRGG